MSSAVYPRRTYGEPASRRSRRRYIGRRSRSPCPAPSYSWTEFVPRTRRSALPRKRPRSSNSCTCGSTGTPIATWNKRSLVSQADSDRASDRLSARRSARQPGRLVAAALSRSARGTPARRAESMRGTRSSMPRSRAQRSRISPGSASGTPSTSQRWGGSANRESTIPGLRGPRLPDPTAANVGTHSLHVGTHHRATAEAVMCVKTAFAGSTRRHASSSRSHSDRAEPGERSGRNKPWLTWRKPAVRICPRIGALLSAISRGFLKWLRQSAPAVGSVDEGFDRSEERLVAHGLVRNCSPPIGNGADWSKSGCSHSNPSRSRAR